MKVLIAYAGRSGTTEKSAKYLGERLERADMVDLKSKIPDISDYDALVIGGSIRMGQLQKEAKKFLSLKKDELLKKKVIYFICCIQQDHADEYFKANFPSELLEKAVCCECFGGELNLDKLKGFDKFIVGVVSKKSEKDKSQKMQLNYNKITEISDKIKTMGK